MKQFFHSAKSKIALGVASSIGATQSALAAITVDTTAMKTDVDTVGTSAVDLVLYIAVLVIGVALLKKFFYSK